MRPAQPLFGGTGIAHADIGFAATDIELFIGGDEFDTEPVLGMPKPPDMGGEEGCGPVAGRDAHRTFAVPLLAPAGKSGEPRLDLRRPLAQLDAGAGQPVARGRAHE